MWGVIFSLGLSPVFFVPAWRLAKRTVRGRPVSLAQAQQLLAQESPAGTVEQGRWAKVTLAPHLATYETRTRALLDLARALQKAGEFLGLQGWRDELYPVYGTSGPGRRAVANQAAFAVERAAAPIFGIQNFGAHINGYSYAEDGTLFMWAARRSSTKPTWPGMLDNMVAGGAPYNMGIRETVVKECQEEASIPAEVAQRARPAGVVSYIHHNPNGLQPEYQFVYDLQLPWDYDGLRPNDGEVEAFYLFSMSELRERLLAGEYKPNCALVCLDFMIRHGVLTPENEPDYLAIIQSMRRALPLPVPSFDVYRDRVH
ncbi:NUDIX hydrolase domain-like protein [Dimargaris cristalligena]|uniref:NUDIX hydrolase domain-like protein n=1 Tax=Dimargaris cristalligena TaxID=215637 RepID=A0A4Q0A2D7_9FUNG|nr:NUDIX hydrolase domain-like protein [Dimargaris cristalligena]|eukprot:RKP39340.1 NUDIX hydrolase domain-like protein [Dimargaris cristalligena]